MLRVEFSGGIELINRVENSVRFSVLTVGLFQDFCKTFDLIDNLLLFQWLPQNLLDIKFILHFLPKIYTQIWSKNRL